nr:MAG TPA: hypothetical protein [Caudoviricetes sp.]DAU79657.1 MAG TPA: hypothetical protein [Caudoviricetes sp.]
MIINDIRFKSIIFNDFRQLVLYSPQGCREPTLGG